MSIPIISRSHLVHCPKNKHNMFLEVMLDKKSIFMGTIIFPIVFAFVYSSFCIVNGRVRLRLVEQVGGGAGGILSR